MSKPNLIGICGKKQVGKNTVASMLQYLFTCEREHSEGSFKDYTARKNNFEYFERISGWNQKSFAHKVKQILSILTGIPVEDMEKEEIKNKFLPNIWARTFLEVNNERIGPFYSNKEAIDYVNKHKIKYFTLGEFPITIRQALQYIGTDVFRNHFDEDVWVKALFSDYYDYTVIKHDTIPEVKDLLNGEYVQYKCYWIITDVRFPNEVDAIKERGGFMIKVERPFANKDNHKSESHVDNISADLLIDNSETLEELFNIVKNSLFPIIKNQ